ncbi:Golgi to ER traffic protein 4 [Blomia tropicalis]|nr:Golgi to ER traffic protein 4 [Blomia tropicalis]
MNRRAILQHQRLLRNLNERFASGDYYQAHQSYRIIVVRLVHEEKFSEAYDLLYEGAIKLLEVGRDNEGNDLALFLVDIMNHLDSANQLKHSEEELIHNIRVLFENIKPNSPERIELVTKSLSIPFLSSAAIRKQFAEVLWKEKSFAESRLHFLYSCDTGDNCGLMLVEYQTTSAYSSEVDLMIAQFVLQVLCTENKQLAKSVFCFYTLNHPQIRCSKPPFMMPLLNFICFLLSAIDKFSGKDNVFNILCTHYEKSLSRDPCYKDYLTQIGQIYFGQEKKSKQGGLFSNLFQSIFDVKEDSTSPEPTNSINVSESIRNQDVDLD